METPQIFTSYDVINLINQLSRRCFDLIMIGITPLKGADPTRCYNQHVVNNYHASEKSYTAECLASFEKLEKPVWRPKGNQRNKFRSVLFTIMKINCCILLS